MNDPEFARRVSPHIGDLYFEAKRSRRLFPAHTLTRLRGLASLCCDILRDETITEWPDGLEKRTALLVRTRRINDGTRELLRSLRLLGMRERATRTGWR